MDAHERRALPEGWEWKRLGEVCEKPEYGYTTSAKPQGNEPLFLRTTDISNGEICWQSVPFCSEPPIDEERYSLKDGDILVARAGSVGASIVIRNPPRSIFASYLIRFRPRNELNPSYAGFFLKSEMYWSQLGSKTAGTTLPGVNATNLAKVKIPLPPLPTQRRIVSILEKAEETKRLRAQAGELTDRLLQSVFLEMFGDPVKNPKGWIVKRANELTFDKSSIICGPFGSQLKIGEYVEEGIPVLGIDNVAVNKFVWAKPKNITRKKYEQLNAFSVRPEDILITRTGTVGRTCVIPKIFGDSVIGPNLLKVTLDKDIMLPEVFATSLSYFPSMIEQIQNLSPGATVPVFNTKNLKALKIVVPPLPLQQKFARIVEKIESMRQSQNQSKQQIEDLFSALMQKAFRGEI